MTHSQVVVQLWPERSPVGGPSISNNGLSPVFCPACEALYPSDLLVITVHTGDNAHMLMHMHETDVACCDTSRHAGVFKGIHDTLFCTWSLKHRSVKSVAAEPEDF